MYQSLEDQNNAYDHRNIKIEYLNFGLNLCIISGWLIDHRLYC